MPRRPNALKPRSRSTSDKLSDAQRPQLPAPPKADSASGFPVSSASTQRAAVGPKLDLCSRYHSALHLAISTLFETLWDTRHYDQLLRSSFSDTLALIHAIGVVVHTGHREVTIACYEDLTDYLKQIEEECPCARNPREWKEGDERRPNDHAAGKDELLLRDQGRLERCLTKLVVDQVSKSIRQQGSTPPGGILRLHLAGQLQCAAVLIPYERKPGRSGRDIVLSPHPPGGAALGFNFCAMLYLKDGSWREGIHKTADELEQEETRFVQTHGLSTLKMLFDIVRSRVRRYSPFPKEVSQRYWEDSAYFMLAGRSAYARRSMGYLAPPWDLDRQIRTASLSFDIRKSTFAMEQADTAKKFAQWLDQLVNILMKVGHLHGGVFDDFKGDGALIHFLDDESKMIYGVRCGAAMAALACAGDMQRAMRFHLARLRTFLRMDSGWLGAGIGIDIAEAYWSIDHRDNPIVVGRGVVGACRLCAKADPSRILLTNIAYQELEPNTRAGLEQIAFDSKELRQELLVKVWQVIQPPGILANTATDENIELLCNHVYESSIVDDTP